MSKTKKQMKEEAQELGILETVQNLLELDQMETANNLIETQQQNQKLQAENQKLKSSTSGMSAIQKLYNSFLNGEQSKNFTLVYDSLTNPNMSNKELLQKSDSSQTNVPSAIKKALCTLYHYNMLNTDTEVYNSLHNELSQIDTNQSEQDQAQSG